MKTLNEIRATPSPYRGSEKSAALVKEEIRRMFGNKIANEYRPELCRSYRQWRKISYAPVPGAKAIKLITVVEERNEKGEVEKTFPKIVNLFNVNQVRRIWN